MKDGSPSTVSAYLIEGILRQGVGHVFGIQGDYVLNFFARLSDSPLELVNTCDEQSAGFAADAYARVTGFGAVCVTYGVGGLKIANCTAQAFAERSPVLVISGAPGVAERGDEALLHHKVRSFETQLNVFREMTVAQAVLDDAGTAASEIDRVIRAIRESSSPGYIELPRDMVGRETVIPARDEPATAPGNHEAIDEALRVFLDMLAAAERPMVIAGIDVHRFGLQDLLLKLLERSGLPFVTGVLGKSVVSELHPQFVGVYAGGMSPKNVREAVEGADFILAIGPLVTDLATGIFTHRLQGAGTVVLAPEGIMVGDRGYGDIRMKQFMEALIEAVPPVRTAAGRPEKRERPSFTPRAGVKITTARLFECLDAFLTDDTTVIAEAGDALFGALDLTIHGEMEFMSPAYYASMGFAVPASIAVQLAAPDRRPLVLAGDGSFQMTGMELSVSARYGLNPIVIVLNNGGYGTLRPMIDGPFNDIPPWRYAEVARVIGQAEGYTVSTEDELSEALRAAEENTSGPTIIDVLLGRRDFSERLRLLTDELKKRTG